MNNIFVVPYDNIIAIIDEAEKNAEIVEFSNCFGGSNWAKHHFPRTSPLVRRGRSYGNSTRYLCRVGQSNVRIVPSTSALGIESIIPTDTEVEITYVGLGGGGVGATKCRSLAKDVINAEISDSGGSKLSKGVITLPKRKRVVIGVDDTDTKDEGATWSLVHNIASKLDSHNSRYISHTIVQLYPVPVKTQNCCATVVEFACINSPLLIKEFEENLSKYTLSDETGMAVLEGFDVTKLKKFGMMCKQKKVSRKEALKKGNEHGVGLYMEGRGIIGALAAIPYYTGPNAVKLKK